MSHSTTLRLSVSLPDGPSSHRSWILGTHGVPSEFDGADIRKVIASGNSDVFKLDYHIANIRELLGRLVGRREEISRHVYIHKALLSPIRRVPDEVLADIFWYCLPCFGKEDYEGHSFRKQQAPLLLGKICRRWRAVTLSTPKLWSFIRVECTRQNVSSNMENLILWLDRSGEHALSLVLHDYDPEHHLALSRTEVAHMLAMLFSVSHRWRHVKIQARYCTILPLWSVRNALPSLQSLAISANDVGSHPLDLNAFEIAPLLSRVDMGLGMSLLSLKIPWAQLSEFASHGMHIAPATCLDILRNCPSLTSCIIEALSYEPVDPSAPELWHYRLTNLHIPSESYLGRFINRLTLPALKTVHLNPQRLSARVWPGLQFLDLLRRSSLGFKFVQYRGYHKMSRENAASRTA
jgi:hypothetical protein